MEKNADVPVSRTWLESLSTGELIKMADGYGIDIPHGLERIFIIEELLVYSSLENEEAKEDLKIDTSYPETAALPKQYNISYIEAVIRDPLWIFAYWEVKSYDREIHEKANDFKGYCLRITPLSESETDSRENSFTIPVGTEDSARYIGITEYSSHENSQTHRSYILKLGVIRGDSELQIAASQPFCLPRLIENEDILNMKENPLVRLSSVANLSTVKNADRQPRIKRL